MKTTVTVKAKVLQTDEVIEIKGNLLVAADGCLSSIRQSFLSDFKLRSVIPTYLELGILRIKFIDGMFPMKFIVCDDRILL